MVKERDSSLPDNNRLSPLFFERRRILEFPFILLFTSFPPTFLFSPFTIILLKYWSSADLFHIDFGYYAALNPPLPILSNGCHRLTGNRRPLDSSRSTSPRSPPGKNRKRRPALQLEDFRVQLLSCRPTNSLYGRSCICIVERRQTDRRSYPWQWVEASWIVNDRAECTEQRNESPAREKRSTLWYIYIKIQSVYDGGCCCCCSNILRALYPRQSWNSCAK